MTDFPISLEGAIKKRDPDSKRSAPASRAVTDQSESVPSPPENMAQAAAAEWLQLAPIAHELGVLTMADERAFRLLCETLATLAEAQDTLDTEGLLIDGAHGAKKHHPSIKILENARQQATRLFAEFGMTPKARSGNFVRAKSGKHNPWAEHGRS